jgi:hypothetical protein
MWQLIMSDANLFFWDTHRTAKVKTAPPDFFGQLPADASQFVLGIEDLPTSAVSANRQLPQRPFGGSRGAMMCGFGMGQNVDIFMDPQEIINDV